MEGNDIKPWFRDDLLRILMGINLASHASMTLDQNSDAFRRGYALALASIAIIIGISPERILLADDLLLLKMQSEIEKKD
jgi:hypothetical protein